MLNKVCRQSVVNSVRSACYGGRHQVTLIPGAGIGPEMCQEVRKAVDILGVPIDFEEVQMRG